MQKETNLANQRVNMKVSDMCMLIVNYFMEFNQMVLLVENQFQGFFENQFLNHENNYLFFYKKNQNK